MAYSPLGQQPHVVVNQSGKTFDNTLNVWEIWKNYSVTVIYRYTCIINPWYIVSIMIILKTVCYLRCIMQPVHMVGPTLFIDILTIRIECDTKLYILVIPQIDVFLIRIIYRYVRYGWCKPPPPFQNCLNG